jgi:uncharacterized protein (TIGR01777 family)
MPIFQHRSRFEASAEEVFDWHMRPGALERLAPPWQPMRVIETEGGMTEGGRVVMEVRLGPRWLRWVALLSDFEAARQFRDTQAEGPFPVWAHTHRFIPDGAEASQLEDHIVYELPLGALGRGVGERFVKRELERMVRHRHRVLREDLARHRAVREHGLRRIALSGASGLVGRNLALFLTSGGHEVARLVRDKARAGTEIPWDPVRGEIDAAALEGVDAVVHLAGANIAQGRWTPERKREILESRVRGTQLLCEALARMPAPPSVLIAASAIGYYGDRGDEWLSERAEPGQGFLAEVCRAWEAATEPARARGIRVVNLRIGVVLSARGGALARMLIPFRLGLGGIVGGGRQYLSWIALDDLIGAIYHLIFAGDVHGPVNGVAPEPVSNREFTKILGRVLHRPTILPMPAAVVRTIFGELGQALLLDGARVSSSSLEQSGFRFLFPDVKSALRAELGQVND